MTYSGFGHRVGSWVDTGVLEEYASVTLKMEAT